MTEPWSNWVWAAAIVGAFLLALPLSSCSPSLLDDDGIILGLGQVYLARYRPGSNRILATGTTAGLQIWDSDTGLKEAIYLAGGSSSFDWSPDGRELTVGTADGRVLLIREGDDGAFNDTEPTTYMIDGSRILSVSHSPMGHGVILGTEGGVLSLLDTGMGYTTTLMRENAPMRSVCWSPDGRTVGAVSGGMLHLVDLVTGNHAGISLSGQGTALAWSPEPDILAVGNGGGMIRLFAVAPQRAEVMEVSCLAGHRGSVTWLEWSRDGLLLASCSSSDSLVKIWNVSNRQEPEECLSLSHGSPVSSVSLSEDGRNAVSVCGDGKVTVWGIPSGETRRVFDQFAAEGKGVSFASWDPRMDEGLGRLAVAEGGRIRIWDISTGRVVTTVDAHSRDIQCLEWSPDGSRIASGSLDHTVKLWHRDGDLAGTLLGHGGGVLSLSWSPDGRLIASGGRDGSIMIWDRGGGAALQVLQAHEDETLCLAWSPSGEYIASSSHSVRIWDVESGGLVYEIGSGGRMVQGVRFSPDGLMLALYVVEAVRGSGEADLNLYMKPNATVTVYDMRTSGVVAEWSFPWNFQSWQGLYGPGRVAWSPDGSLLAFPTGSPLMEVGDTLSYWQRHGWFPESAAVLPVVKLACVGPEPHAGSDGLFGEPVDFVGGFSADVLWVGFSPDGDLVGAASSDGTIHVKRVPEASLPIEPVGIVGLLLALLLRPRTPAGYAS